MCQFAGWGSAVAITWLHILIDDARSPISGVCSTTLFLCACGFSHIYRMVIRLDRWSELNWISITARAALACLLIALANALIAIFLFPGPTPNPANPEFAFRPHFFGVVMANFILMAAWSGIYFGYHFREQYQQIQVNQLRLQVALREAEHRALSAQINPHFLFNSLNTLRSLVEENPEKAREGITELARLFRASLKTTRQNLITLREEMETVHSYLSLEQSRFEDRLIIRSDIPADTMEATLPPFLLQTLIENAIKYGVGPRISAEISFRACLNRKGLLLQVTNPGQIQPPRGQDSVTGIGLENSRLRLQLLFGSKASLNLTSLRENSVLAEALIPQLQGAS